MKRYALVKAAVLGVLSCVSALAFGQLKSNRALDGCRQQILVEPVEGISKDFIRGVDISSLAAVEENRGRFLNKKGEEEDIFKILKDNGVNWVRLRVWNKPVNGGGNNSVEVDIPMALRAKKAGMKLLVDFHYSDFWADPAKQFMPADWVGLSEFSLNAAVENFTKESLEKFIKAGVRPDMVQIGNELNNGFMWPAGKIWGNEGEKAGGMEGFIRLLSSASRGVRGAQGKGNKIKIVVHLADGGKNELYRSIFDPITQAGVDYDVIGLSFYTYWHGSPDDLRANMSDLATRYGKEMICAETAYAFTPDDGDKQGNPFIVYSDETCGYRPSVQGQATAVRDVIEAVASVKGGLGVFYWEPAWLPVKGAGLSNTEGATWENQAMFDFNGRILPSLAVWNLAGGKGEIETAWGGSAKIGRNFEPYAMTDPLVVQVLPKKNPGLPSKVKVLFTNDKEQLVNVKWNEPDWSKQTELGSVKVTGTIAGYSYKPEAEVKIVSQMNLVSDGSFETGRLGEWKLNGDSTACFVENNKNNAHSGKWTYKYWKSTGFKSTLTRKITGLSEGTYTLSLWAMGGGGENNIRLFAANFDDTGKQVSVKIKNTGWKDWHQYTLEIPVQNGSVTIGIFLDTNAGNWGNFDDVELIKKE